MLACVPNAEIRPQHVLLLDTDLEAVGDAPQNFVGAMDTLRVELYDAAGTRLRARRDFVMGTRDNWPLSLGLVGAARIRVRLFRARFASATTDPTSQEPDPAVSVDRVIDLPDVEAQVRRVRVVLRGDCIGHPASLTKGRSCLDAERVDAPADGGEEEVAGAPRVATWAGTQAAPCTQPPPGPAQVCIPGGYDVLGDTTLLGFDAPGEDPLPLRPVLVRALYMDKTEYTVGRFRAKLAQGFVPPSGMPATPVPGGLLRDCTYRGRSVAGADELPLNCVSLGQAAELCAADGGLLPTEAEWEHAARGPGLGRKFPWGETSPACCTASVARDITASTVCDPAGRAPVEPVGSHVGSNSCEGDVSKDGLLDMGGSLSEWTRDRFAPPSACWEPGVVRDPMCLPKAWLGSHTTKGGNFSAGPARAKPAFRNGARADQQSGTDGFRCVYPAGSP